jgi:molybdopterin converting factor small subunit
MGRRARRNSRNWGWRSFELLLSGGHEINIPCPPFPNHFSEGEAVNVRFLGPFKDLIKSYEIEIDCTDLDDLIRKLIERYGPPFENKIMKEGKLNEDAIIVVNGRIVTDSSDMRRELRKDDQVTFLTMTVGG